MPEDKELSAAVAVELGSEPKKPATALKFVPDEKQFKLDVAINPNDLTTAQMNQASLFAHYATLVAKAQFQHDQLKSQLEKKEAILDGVYREALAKEHPKVTEKMVTAAVASDPEVAKLTTLVNQAKMIVGIHKANATAFEQRKDMVVQMGAAARQEMMGEVRTMAASFNGALTGDALEAAKERARAMAGGN